MTTQNLCKSFLLEILQGVHAIGTDTIKLALYTAPLDPDLVTAYTAVNEAAGAGYAAGGVALALTAGFPQLAPTGERKALVDFSDVAIDPVSLTARAALIYNFSKANRAIATVDFGLSYTSNVSMNIIWPPNDAVNCLIQLGA